MDGGTPGAGGGSPGGSVGQIQYQVNGTTLGGAPSFVTASSVTILSSMSVTTGGGLNNISGLSSVFDGNGYTGEGLLVVGTNNHSSEFYVLDGQGMYATQGIVSGPNQLNIGTTSNFNAIQLYNNGTKFF